MYAAERIIEYVVAQEYPKDRFEIQVLDDSTDETVHIVAAKVAEYQAKGYNIEHIHRVNRQGYKASALQEAMLKVKGDFIAISMPILLPVPTSSAPPLPILKIRRWASCRRAGSTSMPTTAC